MQFPNSKFAPEAEQRLREIQEVLAESEMRVGDFYHNKGSFRGGRQPADGRGGSVSAVQPRR